MTHLLMITAYFIHAHRRWHASIMVSIIIIDTGFPFYLYLTHDWWHRLIEKEEIFSFLLWMHFILIITLYMFYAMQVHAALRIIRHHDEEARVDHKSQARGIILLRTLVLMTGALLVD